MILYDVHLHSRFSTDSREEPENIAETAISKGLRGICFTDHMDLYFPEECSKKSGGDFTFDLDGYFEELDELKAKYRNRLDIRIGMEIGLRNETELKSKVVSGYEEMLNKYPFDFIIGSTHCLENIDPYWEEYWYGRTAEEGLDRYFDAIAENVTYYDSFDSLGHLDYLVRYVSDGAALRSTGKNGHKWVYDPLDHIDRTDIILKKIIDKGKALEVNSAGLKYGLGFAHPKKEILERYRELGGELITIGSDSHKSEHLAYEFSNVCEMLKSLGFKYYFVYKNRKPEDFRL